jgi:hypothetical protein
MRRAILAFVLLAAGLAAVKGLGAYVRLRLPLNPEVWLGLGAVLAAIYLCWPAQTRRAVVDYFVGLALTILGMLFSVEALMRLKTGVVAYVVLAYSLYVLGLGVSVLWKYRAARKETRSTADQPR